MCILKHKNVVVNRSDIVRSALPSFNFSLRLDEGMAAEKLVVVSLIVLQKVTNFEKTYLPI